jgi:polysaccharide biosynthesis/export protein
MSFVYNSLENAGCRVLLVCALLFAALQVSAQELAGPARSATDGTSAGASAGAAPSPTSTIPVPGSYVVGEADVLRINVWKQPEISQQNLVVRPDGMISVPLVGEVRVSGMTPVQIETTLVQELRQYVNEPRVTVTVAEVGSKTVYVTGEIQHPGSYPLVGPVDVLQIIAKAGGVTPYAHRRSVFVLREVSGKKEKLPVNYSRIFRGRNPEQNITLRPGDTVVVP